MLLILNIEFNIGFLDFVIGAVDMKRLSISELFLFFFLFSSYGAAYEPISAPLSDKGKEVKPEPKKATGFWDAETPWADSLIQTMNIDEKIGQLFMVAAYSNKGTDHVQEIKSLITKQHIGGLIFFKGTVKKQIEYTNTFQAAAKTPLFIGIDGEWGLKMRLTDSPGFPRQMTLGAIQDNETVYKMGQSIGEHCKRIGVHINFAPVVDVNNNPSNPVINSRSFGEQVNNVATKGIAYMQGMQDQGVMACAKHFPGHGDTDSDSHYTTPVINHDSERLNQIELPPFQRIFDEGVGSVMVAHLNIPALGTEPDKPTTLTKAVVTDLMRTKMKYQGLAFTDALNMKGVASLHEPGESDLLAFEAGNDVLLFPMDVPKAVTLFKEALKSGRITEEQITDRAHRILRAKEFYEAHLFEPIETESVEADLFNGLYEYTSRAIAEQSITLIQNKGMLPLAPKGQKNVAVLTYGDDEMDVFKKSINPFATVSYFHLDTKSSEEDQYRTFYYLDQYDKVIVVLNDPSRKPSRNFGLDTKRIKFAEKIARKTSTTLVWMGNPYALTALRKPEVFNGIVVTYQNNEPTQDALGRLLSGATAFSAKLPVSVGELWKAGHGLKTEAGEFLTPGSPQELNLSEKGLLRIDSIAKIALSKKATPGCQILVAKGGKIVYNKSFGHFTYDDKRAVNNSTIYDLASLTKMLSTTIAIMRLYDEGKFDLRARLGDYLDFIPEDSPYHDILMKDILTHQARFKAWIPFYLDYVDNPTLYKSTFRNRQEVDFPTRVANDLYAVEGIKDTLFKTILNTPLRPKVEYKYSDIGFYFLKEVVEKLSGMPMDDFVKETFYGPMGLTSMGYLPLKNFNTNQIAPTEYDSKFRKQLIQGDVHDPGAAMLGGVSGHAGLFGTSYEVAVIMQMLLNGGSYGDQRYLQKGTIELFTRTQHSDPDENRRGLGFDKPVRDGGPGPTFDGINFESFGHSGFTGTFAWADPVEDIVYVFLSNRVYPTAENRKLIKMNVRSEIQKVIYEAIEEPKHPTKKTYQQ